MLSEIDDSVYDCELAVVDDDVSSVTGLVVGDIDSIDVMKEVLSVVIVAVDGLFVLSLETSMYGDDPVNADDILI